MYRWYRSLAPFTSALLSGAVVLGACSSSKDDTGLGSSGASGGTTGGTSSGARGGTSSGGSANGTGTGGSGGTSGSSGTTGGSGNAPSAGGSGNTSSGGSSNASSSGGSGAYPPDACEGFPFDTAGEGGAGSMSCTGTSAEAESVPIDLFIMMDRSISTGNLVEGGDTTRWEALQAAVKSFVETNRNSDIRAGIGFFGVTGSIDDQINCNQDNYSTPTVAIGELADVGDDLIAAVDAMRPGGRTPAGPALAGALEYATTWAADNVDRATAVVLVSDGFPTECEPRTVSGLSDLAKQAHLNAPYVRTYVIGIGSDVNLDDIALGGGTHEAFKIDEGDISGSFTNALNNVTNSKLDCEYALPAAPDGSQKLDFTKVQVTYTTAGDAATEEIPAISGISSCAKAENGGWYYDDTANPTRILVCPCTCARFDAGRVDVRVGCKPRIGPR